MPNKGMQAGRSNHATGQCFKIILAPLRPLRYTAFSYLFEGRYDAIDGAL